MSTPASNTSAHGKSRWFLAATVGVFAFLAAFAGPASAQYDPGTGSVVLGIAVANGEGTACLETTLPSNITGEYVIIATGVGKTDLLTTEATIVSQSGNDITVCGEGFAPGSDVRFFVKMTGTTDTTVPVGSGTAGGSSPSSGTLVRTGADGSLMAQQVGVGAAAIVLGFGAIAWTRRRQTAQV